MGNRRRRFSPKTLKSYIGFNDVGSGTVKDIVTNDAGILGTNVTFSTDRIAGTHSMSFRDLGGGDALVFNDNIDYSFTDGTNDLQTFTISFWLKHPETTPRANFLGSKRDGSNGEEEWQLFQQSSGNISLLFYNETNALSNYEFVNFAFGFNTVWKKVDIVKDGGTFTTYVDASVVSHTIGSGGTYVKMAHTNSIFRLGNLAGNNGSRVNMDCFSIDSRALTQGEITRRYKIESLGQELITP
jgi:hypothetical protein